MSTLLAKLFTDWGGTGYWDLSLARLSITPAEIVIAILAVIVMNLLDLLIMQNKDSVCFNRYDEAKSVRDTSYVYLLMCICVAWLILLAGNGASSFIYFQF